MNVGDGIGGGSVVNTSITDITGKPPMSVRRQRRHALESAAATMPQKVWRAKSNAKIVEEARRELADDLCDASTAGDIHMLRILVHGSHGKRCIDLNRTQSCDGNTALHPAAEQGHVETIEALLVDGADPDIANRRGWTSLHLAVRNGHVDTATVLLEAGVPKRS